MRSTGSPRPVYKPHSVQRYAGGSRHKHLDGHLSRPGVSAWLVQPTRGSEETGSLLTDANAPKGVSHDGLASAWPCSGWGLPGRAHCWTRRWSLTPPFHPDRFRNRRFVSVARSGRLPHPGSYPASRPVECGLSSISSDSRGYLSKLRPSDQPGNLIILFKTQKVN
jgi:hypothetical protein